MDAETEKAVETLLALHEPSIGLAAKRDLLRKDPSPLIERVRRSTRAKALLAGVAPGSVYQRWHGAHWVMADLAGLGHPPEAAELSRSGIESSASGCTRATSFSFKR